MSLLGYLTGLGAGAFSALEALVIKDIMDEAPQPIFDFREGAHPIFLGLIGHLFNFLFLYLISEHVYEVSIQWGLVLDSPNLMGWVGLNAAAFICYLIGLHALNLSCAIPLLALLPLVAGVTEWLLFNRPLGFFGLIGISLICAGAYSLSSYEEGVVNWTEPFLLFRESPRALFMAATVFFWAFSINFSRSTLETMSFFSTLTIMEAGVTVVFVVITVGWGFFKPYDVFVVSPNIIGGILVMSTLGLTAILFHYTTVSYLFASYASALKRTNVVFSYVLGIFLLKEPTSLPHALSVGLILCGTFVLIFV